MAVVPDGVRTDAVQVSGTGTKPGRAEEVPFQNKLMSLDGSIIDLSVSMFDWAKFRRTKGAIKLHLLLDHDGYLPSFAVVTEGKTSEIKVARTLRFDPGTILAIDRGYIDYEWFRELTQQEVYFVTRMKEKAVYEVKEELKIPQDSNVVSDQIICFPRLAREGETPVLFRRVEILDVEKQETIVFLSNLLAFGATTIAAIYKDRWQVELFFESSTWCTPLDVMEFRGSIGLNRPLVGSPESSVRPHIDRRPLCAESMVRPHRPASPASLSSESAANHWPA